MTGNALPDSQIDDGAEGLRIEYVRFTIAGFRWEQFIDLALRVSLAKRASASAASFSM